MTVMPVWRVKEEADDAILCLSGDWLVRKTGMRTMADVRFAIGSASRFSRARFDTRLLGEWDSALVAHDGSVGRSVKTPSLLLTIHIDEFEGEPAGCVLSDRWSIVGKDEKELDDQEFLITTPMSDRRDAAVAAAMTRDLDQLTIRSRLCCETW